MHHIELCFRKAVEIGHNRTLCDDLEKLSEVVDAPVRGQTWYWPNKKSKLA